MTLTQLIDSLPPQVYLRRGELVIHFSGPADLVARLAETAAVLADLERSSEGGRIDKTERGRGRPSARSVPSSTAGIAAISAGGGDSNADSQS